MQSARKVLLKLFISVSSCKYCVEKNSYSLLLVRRIYYIWPIPKTNLIMKKLFLASFLTIAATFAMAGGYKLDDAAVDAAFENSIDVTENLNEYTALSSGLAMAGEEQTVGGFLLRSYFCGVIALHRSYMGTGGASLWWKYLCIPVAGSIANCVDFWGVVFKGEERLDLYRDNPKFFAWSKG